MQTRNSNDQRAEAVNPDGRRDTERSAVEAAAELAPASVPDAANRTVYLSATIAGKGGATA